MIHCGGRTAHGTHPLTTGLPSLSRLGGQEDPGGSWEPKVEVEETCRSRRGWQVEMAQRDWPRSGSGGSPRKQHPGCDPPFLP